MSTPIRYITDLVTAVMPGVVSDFAVQQPTAPELTHGVGLHAAREHASGPRVVWVPGGKPDEFEAPQKRTAGGSSAQHSRLTRQVALQAVCRADTETAVEDLVECVVRRLALLAGTGAVGITFAAGAWVDESGLATSGEAYSIFVSYPVDIRAQAATPPARPTVTPVLDTSGSGTPGDGTLDSTELP